MMKKMLLGFILATGFLMVYKDIQPYKDFASEHEDRPDPLVQVEITV